MESTNRALWSGTIVYGLLMVPTKLFTVSSSKDTAFKQVHNTDAGRIKFRRICSLDGEEVPYPDVAKGYELPNGEIIILTDEDFASLPLPTSKTIEIDYFCNVEEIPLGQYEKPYFVGPDKEVAFRAYRLLVVAMQQRNVVAVCRVSLRNKESLAVLRPDANGVLMLHLLSWPSEMRTPGFAYPDGDVDKKELTLATALIDAQLQEFDPDELSNRYEDALAKVLEAKTEGIEIPEAPAAPQAPAVSLAEALEASLAAAGKKKPNHAAKSKVPAASRGKKKPA